MKSLRLRSVVFPLGFGRARKPPLDPAHVAPLSTVDSILLVGVSPGGQRNRAGNAWYWVASVNLGNQIRPWFRGLAGNPSADHNRSKVCSETREGVAKCQSRPSYISRSLLRWGQ
jgi:hypothetical protein